MRRPTGLVKDMKLEGNDFEDILQDLDWFSHNRSRQGILTGWMKYEFENGYNWKLLCLDPRNLAPHNEDEKVAFVGRIVGGTQMILMDILGSGVNVCLKILRKEKCLRHWKDRLVKTRS